MEQIRFFILIPVYNAQDYIQACIGSILQQSYPSFQVVAVDDGSTDGSGMLLDRIAEKDSRIKVLHQKNGGQILARQAALSCAMEKARRDDFIFFVDADDALEPNALEVIAGTVQKTQCDLVLWGFRAVYPDGKTWNSGQFRSFTGTVTDKGQLYRHCFCDGGFNPLWCKAARADRFLNYDLSKFAHVRIGEDQLQSIPLYRQSKKAVIIPDLLYIYRIVPTSVTNSLRIENYKVDSTYLRTCWEFLESENVWTQDDWDAYMETCKWTVNSELSGLARLEAGLLKKTALVRLYRDDKFFNRIIQAATVRHPYLLLAKYRMDLLMGLIGSIAHAGGNVKRWLKELYLPN